MVGQAKYMNKFYHTSYLIKTRKTLQIIAKINKTQKLSDLFITAALTEEQYIKTRKADIKTLNKCI